MESLKKAFFLSLGAVIVLWSFYEVLQKPAPERYQDRGAVKNSPLVISPSVLIGEREIIVEIADTNEERTQGLSGRAELEAGHGMLFVFDMPAKHGFWMKDMSFAIDILWTDEKGEIVHIEKSVLPESFPQIYAPETPAKYVLELPAGSAEALGVDTGSKVEFNLQN